MGRMEVITRVERRRRYSDEERAAVLAQCEEPGATVVGAQAGHLGQSYPWLAQDAPRGGAHCQRAVAVHPLRRGRGCRAA